jgi:dUTPase
MTLFTIITSQKNCPLDVVIRELNKRHLEFRDGQNSEINHYSNVLVHCKSGYHHKDTKKQYIKCSNGIATIDPDYTACIKYCMFLLHNLKQPVRKMEFKDI